MKDLEKLSTLIKKWNRLEREISAIIERPGTISNVGEYIASKVFDIVLERSRTRQAYDGVFGNGLLKGLRVNVKISRERESFIDWRDDALPDFFLILAGPKRTSRRKTGESRPVRIASAYLFRVKETRAQLISREVNLPKNRRVQASIAHWQWEAAEVFPNANCDLLVLSSKQRSLLMLFADG